MNRIGSPELAARFDRDELPLIDFARRVGLVAGAH